MKIVMNEHQASAHSSREPLFDIIRGVAVVLMIASHAIFFFHNDSNELLRNLARAGNATVFSIFLFISGAVSFRAYFHASGKSDIRGHIFGRILIIYAGYVAVAAASVITNPRYIGSLEIIRHIGLAAVFADVPSFSEFLIPFIFYPLSLVLFYAFYRRLLSGARPWFHAAFLSYVCGVVLFILPVPEYLAPVRAILAGDEKYLRFPLLQYFPVFLLGLMWGREVEGEYTKTLLLKLFKNIFTVGLLVIGMGIAGIWFSVPLVNPLTRWPPSVGFLALGVFAVYSIALVVLLAPKFTVAKKFWQTLEYVGADSFDLYIVHLLILLAYGRFVGTAYGSVVVVACLTVVLFIFSVLISSLNWSVSPSIFAMGRVSLTNAGRYRFKKRYIAAVAVLSVLIFVQSSASGAAVTGRSAGRSEFLSIPSNVSINRHWFIRRQGKKMEPLVITIADPGESDPGGIFYSIPALSISREFSGDRADTLTGEIRLDTVPAGEYTVIVAARNSIPGFPIFQSKIFVSEPVYVAWSLDWEGWDVADKALEEIDSISRDAGNLPVTHFFNPRIYLPEVVSRDRAKFLTDWVKNRESAAGDEIAMHMHMQFDSVREAGVEPKTEPRWNWHSEDGYDVFMTAYSQDEIEKLLEWSLGQFKLHNLPKPAGFRAGGWYANGNVLGALEAKGFLYDSSGRENPGKGAFGNIPWNLDETTAPFYPSIFDQNTSGPSAFSILEIPNNGLDTFTYAPFDLQQRFFANYKDGVLTAPKAVVYVSHPHWYSVEFPKIKTVLSAVSGLSEARDSGPVVFVTEKEIYDAWKKSSTP